MRQYLLDSETDKLAKDLQLTQLLQFLSAHGYDVSRGLDVSADTLQFELPREQNNTGRLPIRRIPEEFCLFHALVSIDVSRNGLTELPADIGFWFVNLQCLNVTGNTLSVLPPSINQSLQLVELILAGNQLTSLPDLRPLKQLKKLDISDNNFTKLDDWVCGELPALSELQLSGNNVTCLPANIGFLALVSLDCSNCRISQFPESFVRLAPTLTHLSMGLNPMPQLPEVVWRMLQLIELRCGNIDLIQLSDKLGELVNLEFLEVASTCLTSLPKTIALLTQLKTLELYQNVFLTSLCHLEEGDEFERLDQLRVVNLQGCNQLTKLPYGLFAVGKTTRLNIRADNMSRLDVFELPVEDMADTGSSVYRIADNGVFQYNRTRVTHLPPGKAITLKKECVGTLTK